MSTHTPVQDELPLPSEPDFDPNPLLDFMRFTIRQVPDEHRAEVIRIADEELAALGLDPLDPESI